MLSVPFLFFILSLSIVQSYLVHLNLFSFSSNVSPSLCLSFDLTCLHSFWTVSAFVHRLHSIYLSRNTLSAHQVYNHPLLIYWVMLDLHHGYTALSKLNYIQRHPNTYFIESKWHFRVFLPQIIESSIQLCNVAIVTINTKLYHNFNKIVRLLIPFSDDCLIHLKNQI
jgi:hypothetical protein